jgi:hypothetical protein
VEGCVPPRYPLHSLLACAASNATIKRKRCARAPAPAAPSCHCSCRPTACRVAAAGLKVTVKLTVVNRVATVELVPAAATLVIKALAEPERDRKKVRAGRWYHHAAIAIGGLRSYTPRDCTCASWPCCRHSYSFSTTTDPDDRPTPPARADEEH